MNEPRKAFAHDASLTMEPEVELGAPGAAITTALCGHWQHQPPYPLAPHHSSAFRVASREVQSRRLFVVEPSREAEVRGRITAVLSSEKPQR